MKKAFQFTLLSSAIALTACSTVQNVVQKTTDKVSDMTQKITKTDNQSANSLDFDQSKYTQKTATYQGKTITYRAYENIPYVTNPVEPEYQVINIYIPEGYFNNETINGFNKETAPIFYPNGVGGFMPAKPLTVDGKGRMPSKGDNSLVTALAKGYVVASAGARGRTLGTDGNYTGKAPAGIVDLKAGVRYLKHNDKKMFGDANKIISNGTSAGGAMSLLLGSSADQAVYEPYLQQLGSAKASDRIWAVSAYCPIIDLEHADSAYEWQFNGVNDYQKIMPRMLDFNVERKLEKGTLTEEQIKLSNLLKPLFPNYINGLQLKDSQGNLLTLDKAGNGSFKNHVASYIQKSAQQALDNGTDLSNIAYLTIKNGKVTAVDFDLYSKTVGRQKTPPAFDGVDLSAGENQLFGTKTVDKQHFTDFSMQHSTVNNPTRIDESIVKAMNPMTFVNDKNQVAKMPAHWRVRVGTNDRDTSLAIATLFTTKLQNQGKQVNFAMPWAVGHGGDYDLEEMFDWLKTLK